MTHFLQDILRQPAELRVALERLCGPDGSALREAAAVVERADHVYLTGIGSSWHAALNAAPLFHRAGCPVYMQDAAELVHFTKLPRNSAIVALSRSGRSIEIVQLLSKAKQPLASVIALTNSPDGPLAKEAQAAVIVPVVFDYGISVNTYSTIALAAGALAETTAHRFEGLFVEALRACLTEVEDASGRWRDQIENSSWLSPSATYYFLGRGTSLGTVHEAKLLWEEGVKSPATAMGTGAFRHGSQEMVTPGSRFGIWIDPELMRDQDLATARDLRKMGAAVLAIGHNLPDDAGDLVLSLPATPLGWQFIVDMIPAQLAAERLARLSGVDCDTFRFCSYIVEDEHGLLSEEAAALDDAQ